MPTTRSNRALETLQENVDAIRSSAQWKAALALRSRLHSYSWTNIMLISLQRPDATMIAGYRKWQQLGRQVRKGEKSIAILAPLLVKDKDSDDPKARKLVGFRAASVFDIAQTEGDELPQLPSPTLLDGDSAAIRAALDDVTTYAHTLGLTVERVERSALGSANGCYRPATNEIALRDDLTPLHTLKTLIHEVAHALLHADAAQRQDIRLAEVEAETTAYLVADALGLDTGDYTFAYVAGWAGETDALLQAGDRACKAADQVLAAITSEQGVLAA